MSDVQQPSMAGKSASDAVVRAVADADGIDPLDAPPLYEVIDPDALDSLFDGSENGTQHTAVTVTFVYNGYHVTVQSSRTVQVEEEDEGRMHSPRSQNSE